MLIPLAPVGREGRLGELLRLVYQTKADGCDGVFDAIRRKAGGRDKLRKPAQRAWKFEGERRLVIRARCAGASCSRSAATTASARGAGMLPSPVSDRPWRLAEAFAERARERCVTFEAGFERDRENGRTRSTETSGGSFQAQAAHVCDRAFADCPLEDPLELAKGKAGKLRHRRGVDRLIQLLPEMLSHAADALAVRLQRGGTQPVLRRGSAHVRFGRVVST